MYLSTIGAQADAIKLAQRSTPSRSSRRFGELSIPICFFAASMVHGELELRDRRSGGQERRFPLSFLQPLDRPFPMVATADIGRVAAELMQTSSGAAAVVVELGRAAHRVTPEEIAANVR